MDKYREKVRQRGTVDCPFQHYTMKSSTPRVSMTTTHWHPEYEILYMKEGKTEVIVDKQSTSMLPGDIAFISPGRLHAVNTFPAGTHYHAFVFSLELLGLPQTHFFQKEVISPLSAGTHRFPTLLHPGDELYGMVSQAIESIISCSKNNPKRKQIIFSSMLQIFLEMSDTLIPNTDKSTHNNNETVKSALQFLADHYQEHLTLDHIAEHVHLHPNYLCALFKDYTGQTVFQNLIRIRMDHAAELLKTNNSISEVASLCGFDSTGYFSRKFKELHGMTPKEYNLHHRL